MIFLYCSEQLINLGANLHKALRAHLKDTPLHLVPSIDGLRLLLAQPTGKPQDALVVFMAGNRHELGVLHALGDLLTDSHLVLLIYEQSEEIIALAHSLFPRFLCGVDDDYETVAQVVEKILVTRGKPASHINGQVFPQQ